MTAFAWVGLRDEVVVTGTHFGRATATVCFREFPVTGIQQGSGQYNAVAEPTDR